MTQMKTSLQTAVIRIAVMIAAVLVMAGIRPVTAKAVSRWLLCKRNNYL